MKSAKYGTFSLKYFCAIEVDRQDSVESFSVNPIFLDILDVFQESAINSNEITSLFFIAGYCTHSLIKYVNNCESCTQFLSSNQEFSVELQDKTVNVSEYLRNLTRGSLKSPSQIIFDVVIDFYKIFSNILTEKYENVFCNLLDQRLLLKYLFMQQIKISVEAEHMEEKCNNCQKSHEMLFKRLTHVMSNILLNNYSKMISDRLPSQKDGPRKILTFT